MNCTKLFFNDYLRMLVKLANQKKDYKQATVYALALQDKEQEQKATSQAEDIRRVNAQFNVNSIKKERDTLAIRQRRAMALSILLAVILTAAIPLLMFFHRSYRQRKE